MKALLLCTAIIFAALCLGSKALGESPPQPHGTDGGIICGPGTPWPQCP